ncbi:hypothetical protein ACHAPJ_012404 [Fusarium lateritium]
MHPSSYTPLIVFGFAHMSTAAPAACKSGGWVNLASLPTPRQEHGTTAIDDNTIAVLGGNVPTGNSTDLTDSLQLYNIASDTWKTSSPAPYKVNHPNVAAVNGKLYLLGGLINGPAVSGVSVNWIPTGSSHVYDVATDTWTEVSSMPVGTERGSAIVGVHGEMIYLAGGMTTLQDTYQDGVLTVTTFNTTSGEWQRLVAGAAELPESRQHGAGSVIGDTFYVVGGRLFGQTNFRDTVFELDLTNLDAGWKTSESKMPTARGSLNGGAVGDKFYAFGGEGNADTTTGVFNQSQVFDTEAQQWSDLKPMPVPRHGTQAIAVGNKVYVPGGGLQQDGKMVTLNGTTTFQQATAHFDAYCA